VPVLLSLSTGDCLPDDQASTWQQGDVRNDRTGAAIAGETPHRSNDGAMPT